MGFVIIGNPENRRVLSFCATIEQLGYGKATVIAYSDWLSDRPASFLPPQSIVKIDSPGENYLVKSRLIALGGGKDRPLSREEFGKIGDTVAWYKGFTRLLDDIDRVAGLSPTTRLMNATKDIQLMFDKRRCQQYLKERGVRVPFSLPAIGSYAELLTAMREFHLSRVFIKPAHTSSASGIVAFRKQGSKLQAITPVEMVTDATGIKLFNSLTITTYTREEEAAKLIDTLMAENVLVEEWIPKATLQNLFFDIRILVIAGKARHTVFRMSQNIITNLHLGNKRGDLQEFRNYIGEEKFSEIRSLAEKTAACFPDSLYMGIDLLLSADGRKVFVLEVNAFGDLLPGLTDAGETCYEAQIQAMMLKQRQPA